MADLRGHERSNLFKFAFISETVRDKSETEQVLYPYRVTACKITNFEIFDFYITWPRKRKFAVISETVRDRAKRIDFFTLTGLMHAK